MHAVGLTVLGEPLMCECVQLAAANAPGADTTDSTHCNEGVENYLQQDFCIDKGWWFTLAIPVVSVRVIPHALRLSLFKKARGLDTLILAWVTAEVITHRVVETAFPQLKASLRLVPMRYFVSLRKGHVQVNVFDPVLEVGRPTVISANSPE